MVLWYAILCSRSTVEMKQYFKIIFFLYLLLITKLVTAIEPTPCLFKPTGKYAVSMKSYSLINSNICPDNFYRESDQSFYLNSNNKKHCHMLKAYIYYPTTSKSKDYLSYDIDSILRVKNDIQTNKIDPEKKQIAEKYISLLEGMLSYVLPAKRVAPGKFPLIIFQPGFSVSTTKYQDFIVNLVSNGYIVAAIDSAYSSPLVESFGYMTSREIEMAKDGKPSIPFMLSLLDDKNSNLAAMQSDYKLVANKLIAGELNPAISKHINFNEIGGMGHSLGARSVYEMSLNKDSSLKAFISLDFGQSRDQPKHIYKPTIPSLLFRPANDGDAAAMMGTSADFYLKKHDYIVEMVTKDNDHEYSKHSSFSDFKTLIESSSSCMLRTETYGDINSPWYDSGTSYATGMASLGNANGTEFFSAVNKYIITFFDSVLKNKPSNELSRCKPLTKNSQLHCGPIIFKSSQD